MPPEAESPVEGSNTPILITLSPAAAELPVLAAPPEVELPEDEGVVDEMRYTFALLPKEDFWADRANYKN